MPTTCINLEHIIINDVWTAFSDLNGLMLDAMQSEGERQGFQMQAVPRQEMVSSENISCALGSVNSVQPVLESTCLSHIFSSLTVVPRPI